MHVHRETVDNESQISGNTSEMGGSEKTNESRVIPIVSSQHTDTSLLEREKHGKVERKRVHIEETPKEMLNAFIIELMAAEMEIEEDVMCDLLESTFQCFPDRDYCLITLPANRAHFPLLDFFTV